MVIEVDNQYYGSTSQEHGVRWRRLWSLGLPVDFSFACPVLNFTFILKALWSVGF